MPERSTVNQRAQIAAETTSGTSVPANKIIECFDFWFSPKVNAKTYRGTGRRWASVQEINQEWNEIKITGNLDYQGFVYLPSSAWGAATITTHTGGTTSKDWVWTPPTTGAITKKTYTIEQGDSTRAHKATYCMVTSFGYKGNRQDFTCDAAMITQQLQDNITLTASPSVIALQPVVSKQINLYIDTTSAGIGVTQYTKAFEFEYKWDAGAGPFWPLNRANASFAGDIDLAPKNTIKMLLEADSQGMGLFTNLKNGDYLYLRVDCVGNIIESAITYALQHDICVKLTNIDPFSDSNGVFAIGYEGEVMEDANWASGQAQKLTLTNLLTGL